MLCAYELLGLLSVPAVVLPPSGCKGVVRETECARNEFSRVKLANAGTAISQRRQTILRVLRNERCKREKERDPSYLFTCHLEWRDRGDVKAYHELVAALDDPDEEVRAVAETLLHRSSPRPRPKDTE